MASLLICRDLKDLTLLNRMRSDSGAGIVVASDDLRVHRAAKKDSRVGKVMFIEQTESLFSVSDSVLEFREEINRWLAARGPAVPRYLLEWIKWAEGGETTQRIQDALLLVDSYRVLLSNDIMELQIRRRRKSRWEDEILLETARSVGVAVVELKSFSSRIGGAFSFVAVRRRFFGKERELYVPQVIIPFLKALTLFLRVLYSKVETRKTAVSAKSKRVLFLMASSSEKHVNNAAIVMHEFRRRDGYQPIALCWGALNGYREIRRRRLDAENLERWFPFGATARVLRTHRAVKRSCKAHYGGFENSPVLKYKGVPIGRILLPSVRKFVRYELLSRLVFSLAAKNYLRHNAPAAMRTWGENILDAGLIFYELLRESSDRVRLGRPLVFDYPVGLTFAMPYRNTERKPDLFMLSGEQDREIYEDATGDSSNVVVVGFGQDSKLRDFMRRFTPEDSREKLEIPALNKYKLFYAPTGILRGFVSPGEHSSIARCLVEFAISSREVLLVIKPHPSEPESFWQELLREYGSLANVYLIGKNVSPYHCINVSDLVITKFSTVALEAMEFGKPVISIALDHESKFQDIFEDAVEKFTDVEPFVSFLGHITSSSETFAAWTTKRVKAQDSFLPRKMHKSTEPVEKVIVDKVIEALSKSSSVVEA